jgi:hypothetical protein
MDELRDAGRLVHGDILAGGDWIRAELKDSSSCFTCGSLMPAIIEGRFCCDCEGENAASFEAAWTARRETTA